MPFLRRYNLTISKPPQLDTSNKTITPEEGSVKVVTSQEDFRAVDTTNAITVSELQVTTQIKSGKDKSDAGCTIEVMGLSNQSLAYIQDGSVIILEAGYDDDPRLPVIFAGQVVSADISTKSNTSVAKISCKDGYSPASVKVSKYYPAGISYLDVLEDLASVYADNGIPLGRDIGGLASLQGVGVTSPADSIVLADGFSLMGFLDTALDQVCDDIGFTHYITNARLFIEPKNYEQFTSRFTLPPSNIISARQSVSKSLNINSADSQEEKNVWRVEMFLDGRIAAGNFIEVNVPSVINGTFKVVNVGHNLDFEGSQWTTVMEVQSA